MTDIAQAVQDFSFDLYRKVSRTPGNAVVAPYSVALVLAMAMAGARGETAEEFRHLLRTDDPGAYGRELLNRTSGRSRAVEGTPSFGEGVQLDVANSLWVQQGTSWKQDFLATLANGFDAEPRLTDFVGAATEAAELINNWVQKETRDKIKNLVDPSMFDALTRMVLANAAYFKAPWDSRFDDAQPADFTTGDGRKVTAHLMPKTLQKVPYRKADAWQAIAVPFRGRRLAMALVLPNEGVELSSVVESMAMTGLGEVVGGLRPAPKAYVEVPRWKFTVKSTLNGPLAELGLRSAFGRGSDFSGMTEEAPLLVSKVVHQAYVAVDEDGAEAAAATGMIVAVRSGPAVEPPRMIFDRPFLFMIFDQQSKTPLFIGRVDDPTAA